MFGRENRPLYDFNFTDVYPDPVDYDVENAIAQIEDLRQCRQSFTNISKLNLQKWKTYADLEYCWESNRIEGNPLTLEESFLILAADEVIPQRPLSAHFDIVNHREAIRYIEFCIQNHQELDAGILKNLQYLIMRIANPNEAGSYRRRDISIVGSRNAPPKFQEVSSLVEELIQFYRQNKKTIHPIILASIMHARIAIIHPFVDGTGRSTRLLMNYILQENGYPTANISGDAEDKIYYYNLLENFQGEKGQERFVVFIAKMIRNSYFKELNYLGNVYAIEDGLGQYFFKRLTRISEHSIESQKYDKKYGIFTAIENYLLSLAAKHSTI